MRAGVAGRRGPAGASTTAYPWDGRVAVEIVEAPATSRGRWRSAVPAWCRRGGDRVARRRRRRCPCRPGDAARVTATRRGGPATASSSTSPMTPRVTRPAPADRRGPRTASRSSGVRSSTAWRPPTSRAGVELEDVRIAPDAALARRGSRGPRETASSGVDAAGRRAGRGPRPSIRSGRRSRCGPIPVPRSGPNREPAGMRVWIPRDRGAVDGSPLAPIGRRRRRRFADDQRRLDDLIPRLAARAAGRARRRSPSRTPARTISRGRHPERRQRRDRVGREQDVVEADDRQVARAPSGPSLYAA